MTGSPRWVGKNGAMEDWQTLAEEIRFDTKKALKLIAKGFGIKTPADAYESPLVTAARRGDLAVVEALLAKGADAHATRKGADTALIVALKAHHVEVAKALWPKSPAPTREYFATDDALQTRTHAGVDALIEAQLGPTPRPAGLTRLHVGVLSGDAAVVAQALAAGDDPAAKTTAALEVRAPGTRDKVKLRAGLTAAGMTSALAKAAPALMAAVVASLGAKAKKAPAKKVTTVRVPVIAGGPHAGLRAVPRMATNGLFEPFLANNDDYHRDEVLLSTATVDTRALGLFEARFEVMVRGLEPGDVAGAHRALSRSITALETAGPGVWKSTSLLKKTGPVSGTPPAVTPDREGERAFVAKWLKAMEGGADATDFLLDATRRADDALVATRVLRQEHHVRAPAWFYAPSLAVPDALLERVAAKADEPIILWDAEREARVTTRLMELLASKDLDLAESAAASLPNWSELESVRHPTWLAFGETQRAALFDALVALLERCREKDGRVPMRGKWTGWVHAAKQLVPHLKKTRGNPFAKVTVYTP